MVLDPFDALEREDGSPFEDDGTTSDANDSDEFQGVITEIPRETLLAFMSALFFAHVGLFAVSLGLLLVYFREQWTVGSVLVVGGLVALSLTVWVYRWHEENERDEPQQ